MKKIFTLAYVGFSFLTQEAQAYYPVNLSDVVPVNSVAKEDQRPVQQAAALILRAHWNKSFYSLAKEFKVRFDNNERKLFEDVCSVVPKMGLAYVMQALNEGTLNLNREGVSYTLSDNKGMSACFRIGTLEHLNNETFNGVVSDFYESVQKLCTISLNGQGKWHVALNKLNGKELDDQVHNLMGVLRTLHDYKYLGISDESYKNIVIGLRNKEKELWAEGAVQMLCGKGPISFGVTKPYTIIPILLGQILNHMDGEKRRFTISMNDSFSPGSISSCFLNVLVELIFHSSNEASNSLSSGDISALIVQTQMKLMPDTISRIISFSNTPRPDLYSRVDPLFFYALENPNSVEKFLKEFDDNNTHLFTYLQSNKVDAELKEVILKSFNMRPESEKIKIYISYFNDINATDEQMKEILSAVKKFANDCYKVSVYHAYFKRKGARRNEIDGILNEARKFENGVKSRVYAAYIECKALNIIQIEAMLEEAKTFANIWDRLPVYVAYSKLLFCKLEKLSVIFEEIDFMSNQDKSALYQAYLGRRDADARLIQKYDMRAVVKNSNIIV